MPWSSADDPDQPEPAWVDPEPLRVGAQLPGCSERVVDRHGGRQKQRYRMTRHRPRTNERGRRTSEVRRPGLAAVHAVGQLGGSSYPYLYAPGGCALVRRPFARPLARFHVRPSADRRIRRSATRHEHPTGTRRGCEAGRHAAGSRRSPGQTFVTQRFAARAGSGAARTPYPPARRTPAPPGGLAGRSSIGGRSPTRGRQTVTLQHVRSARPPGETAKRRPPAKSRNQSTGRLRAASTAQPPMSNGRPDGLIASMAPRAAPGTTATRRPSDHEMT